MDKYNKYKGNRSLLSVLLLGNLVLISSCKDHLFKSPQFKKQTIEVSKPISFAQEAINKDVHQELGYQDYSRTIEATTRLIHTVAPLEDVEEQRVAQTSELNESESSVADGDNSLYGEESSDINNADLSDEQTNNANNNVEESKNSFIEGNSRSWRDYLPPVPFVIQVFLKELWKLANGS